MSKPLPKRRGAVLVVALVCLLVIMSLLGSVLLSALRNTRQLHAERNLRQCELLLQAGVDRALFRIAQDPGYTGETRDLSPAEIIDQGAGQITIAVQSAMADSPAQLKVTAEYPFGNEFSVRRSRTLSLSTNNR